MPEKIYKLLNAVSATEYTSSIEGNLKIIKELVKISGCLIRWDVSGGEKITQISWFAS